MVSQPAGVRRGASPPTQRAGLRLTPINWHLTADEAAYIVDDCEAQAFVADARFAEVAAARGRAGARAPPCAWRSAAPIDGFEPYDDALAAEDGADIDDPQLGRSMLYTSGTTGRPKGVHRADGAAAVAAIGGRLLRLRRRASAAPVHRAAVPRRAAGLLARRRRCNAGVGVVLMDGWSPEETLRLIDEHGITHTHMVPTMFHRLLPLPDDVRAAADVSSLRFVLHGAAPCPVAVKQAIIDWWGPVVFEYYAATEGAGTFVDRADVARPARARSGKRRRRRPHPDRRRRRATPLPRRRGRAPCT